MSFTTTDTKANFVALLKELELTVVQKIFEDNGWMTLEDFAYAPADREKFETEILPKILKLDDADQKKLIPRVRKLWNKAYAAANSVMSAELQPQAPTERVHLTGADRADRIKNFKQDMKGVDCSGPNMPATSLVDRYVTVLARGHVKWFAWEQLISREQEMCSETEQKGLRVTADGLLLQDVNPDPTTTLAGEFMWEYALRRRSIACDLSGLCKYGVMDRWTETLKTYLLKEAPTGYRKVGWHQLLAADKALWHEVAMHTEEGCKADPSDTTLGGVTRFQHWFVQLMSSSDVRVPLMFLPAGSSSSSSALGGGKASSSTPGNFNSQFQKNQNKIEQQQNQINNLKRKLDGTPKGSPKGGGGKGKGKKNGNGKQKSYMKSPPEWGELSSVMANGERLCFNYNGQAGCPLAGDGEKCFKGRHLCPLCFEAHCFIKSHKSRAA